MQKLIPAIALVAFASCATAPKEPPKPFSPPVVAPRPPSEPFGAMIEARRDPASFDPSGSDHVTRREFKDHFLGAYTAADWLDGAQDGSAPIAESCKELVDICKAADRNGDGKLSLKEFLDKLDELFDQADMNHDRVLKRREIERLAQGG